jgi:hypothetical protein
MNIIWVKAGKTSAESLLSPATMPWTEKEATRASGGDSAGPFLSGNRLGAGEGGGLGNRHADVDRVTRCLSRVRFCSPSVTSVELGLAGG